MFLLLRPRQTKQCRSSCFRAYILPPPFCAVHSDVVALPSRGLLPIYLRQSCPCHVTGVQLQTGGKEAGRAGSGEARFIRFLRLLPIAPPPRPVEPNYFKHLKHPLRCSHPSTHIHSCSSARLFVLFGMSRAQILKMMTDMSIVVDLVSRMPARVRVAWSRMVMACVGDLNHSQPRSNGTKSRRDPTRPWGSLTENAKTNVVLQRYYVRTPLYCKSMPLSMLVPAYFSKMKHPPPRNILQNSALPEIFLSCRL